MAYVKKEKEVAVSEKEVEVVEQEVKVEAPKTPAKRKQIDKSQEVVCRSVVNGSLIYTSRRSHMTVEWDAYGDIQYITVEELLTMKTQQPKFLSDPWLIIEDDEVVDFLGLRATYDKILPMEDVESYLLYTPVNELEDTLSKAPKGIKELVADKAREMIASEQLYDNRIIKALDKILNIDLSMIQG